MDLLKLIIENIAPILTAITGLLGAYGAWKGIKHYKEKKDSDTIGIKPEMDNDLIQKLQNQIAMYELKISLDNETKRIMENPRARRVAILKAHNNGKDMHLGSIKKITMEVEEVSGCESVIKDWQERPIPTGYVEEVLNPILERKEILLKTPDLSTSELRSVYKSDGVKQSWVFLLHVTPGQVGLSEIFYLSIGIGDEEGRDHSFRKLIKSVVSNCYTLYEHNAEIMNKQLVEV